MATPVRSALTERDLLAAPKDGRKYELVDGEIRVSPAGTLHGKVSAEILIRLGSFVKERGLGHVFDSSTGFRLPNGNIRSPDIAFVALGRFENERPPDGFGPFPPDLAIEVLSPEDRSKDVLEKVGEYLDAGVRLVWVIDPRSRSAVVYRSSRDVRTLGAADDLDGESVVPDFRCPVREIT